MKAKILCAFAVLVLAPSVLADCNTETGYPVNLSELVGRWYSVQFMSGVDSDTTDIYSEILDNGDGTATVNYYTLVNGVYDGIAKKSKLSQIAPGKYLRTFDDGTVRIQFIMSLTNIWDRDFKMSFILCEEGNPIPIRYAFVSNMYGADFTDDIKKMQERYEMKSMLWLANSGSPFEYITVSDGATTSS